MLDGNFSEKNLRVIKLLFCERGLKFFLPYQRSTYSCKTRYLRSYFFGSWKYPRKYCRSSRCLPCRATHHERNQNLFFTPKWYHERPCHYYLLFGLVWYWNFSFIVSELVLVNPDNSRAECVNMRIPQGQVMTDLALRRVVFDLVLQYSKPTRKINHCNKNSVTWCGSFRFSLKSNWKWVLFQFALLSKTLIDCLKDLTNWIQNQTQSRLKHLNAHALWRIWFEFTLVYIFFACHSLVLLLLFELERSLLH